MSPEERSIEAEFLKQRWSLIQSGIDRKFIKIKKASIYVSNKLYGSIKKLKFIMATECADITDQSAVAPTNNVSILAPVVETERSDVTDQSAIAPTNNVSNSAHVVETLNNRSSSNTNTPAIEATPSNHHI